MGILATSERKGKDADYGDSVFESPSQFLRPHPNQQALFHTDRQVDRGRSPMLPSAGQDHMQQFHEDDDVRLVK